MESDAKEAEDDGVEEVSEDMGDHQDQDYIRSEASEEDDDGQL